MTKKRKVISTKSQSKKRRARLAVRRPARKRVKTVQRLDWQGILVSVSYEPDWLGLAKLGDVSNAHLEIQALSPEARGVADHRHRLSLAVPFGSAR